MHCKEICFRYIVKSIVPKEIGPYGFGLKRCSSCEIYLDWNGNHCPCCGHFLRKKPRNAKGRDKLTQKNLLKKF